MTAAASGGKPSRGHPLVDAAQFEALFLRELKCPPELMERFKGFGFDADNMKPTYPMEVFARCADEAALHFHPGVAKEQGSWLMGRAFLRGYYGTIVGSVIKATAAMMSPAQVLKRMPQFMKAGAAQIPVTVFEEGPQRFRLEFFTLPDVTPEYMAGIVEESIVGRKVEARVELQKKVPGEFTVTVSW